MEKTPLLSLPFIMAAQAQKHITHNEALRALDAVVQIGIVSRGATLPPSEPANGERHIPGVGASDAWSGHDHQLAAFQDGAWFFYQPQAGWLAWVDDESRLILWDGTQWIDAIPAFNPVPMVGVNGTADTTNRLAVKSDAVLFSHDDLTPGVGDMRLTLNKATAGNTASLLFQSGYSGRAEFGLTGDDHWRVKVSADGATWHDVLTIDTDSGNVGIGVPDPTAALHVDGPARVGAFTRATTPIASQAGQGSIILVSDEAGGSVLAFSDGTNWRRVTDRAVIT